MIWKALILGVFIAIGILDWLLVWACSELEKRRNRK